MHYPFIPFISFFYTRTTYETLVVSDYFLQLGSTWIVDIFPLGGSKFFRCIVTDYLLTLLQERFASIQYPENR